MTIRWKMVAIVGGSAFLLSLLIGIFAGNPFGWIILKALIFGIIFAGLSVGASFLYDKFFQESAARTPGETEAVDPESAAGAGFEGLDAVDITLPEENPHQAAASGRKSVPRPVKADSSEEVAEAVDDAEELFADSESGPLAAETEAEDDGESELNREQDDGEEDDTEESASPDEVPAHAADMAADRNEEETDGGSRRQEMAADDGLDVLPDMGGFDSSFASAGTNGGASGAMATPTVAGHRKPVDIHHADPATYAQAVRTIIKKDEEGHKRYGG